MKTEKLILQVAQADKLALQRMAQAEGEPVAVIVRRIIRNAVRTTAPTEAQFQSAEQQREKGQDAERQVLPH